MYGSVFIEKIFLKALGNTITNSQDWDGGRKEREERSAAKKMKLMNDYPPEP